MPQVENIEAGSR